MIWIAIFQQREMLSMYNIIKYLLAGDAAQIKGCIVKHPYTACHSHLQYTSLHVVKCALYMSFTLLYVCGVQV